jgi:Flp pilus assembly protein TadD
LAGGDANQSAQKRDNINQLLGQTDQNLKKAEEMRLSASQQEIVTQARQYVVQSKTAMANGDFERARTLAWKAQLLSQDLANPPK